jgi:hypothetical protein
MSNWSPRAVDPNREWIKDKSVTIYLGDSKIELLHVHRSWDNAKQTHLLTHFDAAFFCGAPIPKDHDSKNWLFHDKTYRESKNLIRAYVKEVTAMYRDMLRTPSNFSDPLDELRTQ